MNTAILCLVLAGPWRLALDPADTGFPQRWTHTINLPGTLPGHGIGGDVTLDTKWTGGIVDKSFFTAPEFEQYRQPGNVKVPFWLQPDKYYAGVAWYQRDIEILADWRGKRVVLHLERPHWETRVWLDEQLFGSNNSLSTPHDYDLGLLKPGKHTVTIRVDNRMVIDIGENSHSVSDHTQGNWNGIVGKIELRATPPVWIEDVQVYPNVAKRSVRVKVKKGGQGSATLRVGTKRVEITDVAEVEAPVEPKFWDEFAPNLQELTVRVGDDQRTIRFGLREFSAQGTQFEINGRKTFIRGTLDCCIFPKTGHPPTDVAEWKRIIGVAKAHGLNLIRFHSWCPPEAAFVAADEMGFYLHVEASSWANQSTTLGDGKPVDKWVYEETDRILKYYGNHPSFVLMAYGNEPGGKNHKAYLAKYVNHYKALDPRRLWTSGAGWPELPENQWHCDPHPRIQSWGGGLKSRINLKPPETTTDYRDYISKCSVPVVSHEIGQWCVYPNFDEIRKYTGYLKPKNFEIFRDRLAEHHMSDLARKFLLASGKLQVLCYKEDIESALRTPGMAGFELLDLHDFPGQGTALVGVLDPFWEEKGYVTPLEYSRFCNSTVPLARLAKRVFTTDEKLEASLEVAHYGPEPLKGVVAWKLVADNGRIVASGRGNVSVELKSVPVPARYKLVASVDGFENDWDVWVYPAKVDTQPPSGVTIVEELAADATGKVLLLVPPVRVKNAAKDRIVMGFSSIFWNTAWTRRQAPTTLGILCDPKHPMFAHFPTDFHTNWQWWYLISRAAPMILDDLPASFRPTVQVIDDWFTARKLGLVFEANIGKAKVVVCSIALDDSNPVARQMRHSLLHYMASNKFAPKQTLELSAVQKLFGPVGSVRSVRASSEASSYEAANRLQTAKMPFRAPICWADSYPLHSAQMNRLSVCSFR
ncbi:MAG: glycoside hydrolase [Verrucomicrobia bacterium]|nr:glycoside hydrolase [Verrucomicrobiota bacterium]